jgi:hypothetical protein
MASDNFDFGGHIEHDRDVNPSPYTDEEETCLSPLGYLRAYLGWERGKNIYEGLQHLAAIPTKEHGGIAGIAFDVNGGRFIAITEPDTPADE